jgi:hypothetical protein
VCQKETVGLAVSDATDLRWYLSYSSGCDLKHEELDLSPLGYDRILANEPILELNVI